VEGYHNSGYRYGAVPPAGWKAKLLMGADGLWTAAFWDELGRPASAAAANEAKRAEGASRLGRGN
jgi:hypothetical protein